MKKFGIVALVIVALVMVFGLTVFLSYRVWEESHTAKEVTIFVLTADNTPIPETIIRLESEVENFAIQTMADSKGKTSFGRLTAGPYKIRATTVYCDDGKTEAQTIAVKIQGSNVQINYYPCS